MNPEFQAAIDERLEAALATANYRITLNTQKQNARLRLERELTYSAHGGIFAITPELISFLQTLIQLGKSSTILLDMNKNPIEIPDIAQLLESVVERYYECMNEFIVEFKSIQRARSTKALVGE